MAENNELPISLKELEKKKESLAQINVNIGTILEMTEDVREILGNGNYKKDQLLIRKVEILGHNLFKIEFTFPVYDIVTDDLPNEHVSIVQMQLAIVQGILTAIGLGIRQNGVNSPMSYETFLLNRGNILYRRDQKTLRKKLKFNERCYLIYKLREPIKKGNMYCITIDIVKDKDTFLDGWVEGLIQDEYLFDEEKKDFKDTKNIEIISTETMVGNIRTRFEANENIRKTISITDKIEDQESQK